MKDKTNPVDESNRLLQQLNTVLVSDLNGNAFSKTSGASDWNQVRIDIGGGLGGGNGGLLSEVDSNATRNSSGLEGRYRKDSSASSENCTGNYEELNDPAKSIGRVGEEHMRNVLFFLGFVAKFLQLVVASALLILAIEWLPLHNFLEEHVDNMFFSFLALGLICAGLLLIKFKGRFLVVLLVNMLFMINFFWYMAASSFDFLVFSPYWIVLCAITQTAACLFLSVLVYFQKATYRGCGIYGYATVVPMLFLILSQPYYFWWYIKLTGGDEFGAVLQPHSEPLKFTDDLDSSSDSSTLSPEYYATTNSPLTFIEQHHHEQKRQEMLMSYPYYMINVCSGIGLALVMTFEMVAWSQYSVKGLRFKAGTGILSGSFTALNGEGEDSGNVQPVNL